MILLEIDGVINLVEDFTSSFVEITELVAGLALELLVTMVTTVNDIIEGEDTRLVDVTATEVIEVASMAVSDAGNEAIYELEGASVTMEKSCTELDRGSTELDRGILEDVVATEGTTVELISILVLRSNWLL